MENTVIWNCGSSSKKWTVYNSKKYIIARGEYKKRDNVYTLTHGDTTISIEHEIFNAPVVHCLSLLSEEYNTDRNTLKNTIHRIVHGGETFTHITQLTEETIQQISRFSDFAPLHNPPALALIEQIKAMLPSANHFAVLDTAFHTTVPLEHKLYGLPYGYYENLGIQRFGFHGISYQSLLRQAPFLKKQKVIACHLGSGASVCAINQGMSADHSFGFSPDENLIMSTRAGEIDYDAVAYIKRTLGLTEKDVETMINYESGLLGISGYTNDMERLVNDLETNERAKLAVNMFCHCVAEYIARMCVSLPNADTLVFTGGIGEASPQIRANIIKKIYQFGWDIDHVKNTEHIMPLDVTDISASTITKKIYIIPSQEHTEMVNQFIELNNSIA